MSKKILFVSHTTNFIKFNIPFITWFRNMGWEVHYASAEEEPFPENLCDRHFPISFRRSPYHFQNIKAYKQLKKLIASEKYDIIHCHTPVGGVITRLAAKDFRQTRGTKILYTAHGFHFYKGAPIKNWLLFYPIEKLLSKYTDCIITMNEEDFKSAHKFYAKKVEKISGVGVNIEKFTPISMDKKAHLRKRHSIAQDSFVAIYVAEFTKNKNHALILRHLPDLVRKIPNLKVLFAGEGKEIDFCKNLAQTLQVSDHVSFLGYRSDVNEFYALADILISTSQREGLPLNIIEGMATGLPVVCADIRGQRDVVQPGRNGFMYPLNDTKKLDVYITKLFSSPQLCTKIKENNIKDVRQYSLDNALKNMEKIYKEYM